MEFRVFRRAFTLLELMVVMAIIGLIASLIFAALTSARRKSRDSQRISNIAELRKALDLYYESQHIYPSALSNLSSSTACGSGPCMPQIPKDPLKGTMYPYIQLSSGTSYHMGAILEDPASVPKGDRDFDSSGSGGFKGDSTDCAITSGPPDNCYDLSP